jgi:hypothetical protein
MSEVDAFGDLPFALKMWIIKNQKEILAHREKMVAKNWKDDCEQYMKFLGEIVAKWSVLREKDKLFIMQLANWHGQHRNFSVSQRSAIATMHLKYVADIKQKK